MKRGFTLVEMLAVITLLGLLALVIIPSTESIIKGSQKDAYNAQINSLKSSLKDWAAENTLRLPQSEGDYMEITLGDLKKEGFVEVEFKDPRNDNCISNNTTLRITKTKNNYSYTIEGDVTTSDTCEVE